MEEDEKESLVRLRLLVSNDRMRSLRRELGWTQQQLAQYSGIYFYRIQEIERLIGLPTEIERETIADLLGKPVDYVFPESILDAVRQETFRVREKKISEPLVMSLNEAISRNLLPAGEDPTDEACDVIDKELLKKQVQEVLTTLSPREQKVIKLRFGLEDGCERTLKQVGKELNRSTQSVLVVEHKALSRLRHPSRSRKLKDYLK